MKLDMHFHSTISDGITSPEGLLYRAKDLWLDYIALTDHDIVSDGFSRLAKNSWIESCQAVEISACNYENDRSLHLTCYSEKFSWDILDVLDNTIQKKQIVIRKQLEKLKEKWFYLDIDDFYKYFLSVWKKIESLNRFDVAWYIFLDIRNQYIINKLCWKQWVWVIEFFTRFLKKLWDFNHEYEVKIDDYEPSIEVAWQLAKQNKALLSIAHPNFTFKKWISEFEAELPYYVERGVYGVEVNAKATKDWVEAILEARDKYGLILTFWSDSHKIGRADDKHWDFWDMNSLVPEALVAKNHELFRKAIS